MGLNKYWLPIIGFPNYLISNYGEVLSKASNKMLRQWKHTNGRSYYVSLARNGNGYSKSVSKLVTKHFKNDWTYQKQYAIHLNLNPENNKESNLRVSTRGDMLRFWNQKTNRIRGVYKHEYGNKPFRAALKIDNKVKTIGYFETEYDAAIEYFMEYKKLYGVYPYDPKLLVSHYSGVDNV